MSEFKHTLGPWHADKADMFGDHNIVPPNEEACVAAVVSNLRPADEVASNARLIAAAPEMVVLLEEAAAPWAIMTNAELVHDAAHGDKHAAWLIRVRDILAKIKGETA